jgi:hypothetical protein
MEMMARIKNKRKGRRMKSESKLRDEVAWLTLW